MREGDRTAGRKEKIETAGPESVMASPLYGVAMLKIAMELKRTPETGLDAIMSSVLQRMKLPEDEFREFLSNNGALLRAIAAKKKF